MGKVIEIKLTQVHHDAICRTALGVARPFEQCETCQSDQRAIDNADAIVTEDVSSLYNGGHPEYWTVYHFEGALRLTINHYWLDIIEVSSGN